MKEERGKSDSVCEGVNIMINNGISATKRGCKEY